MKEDKTFFVTGGGTGGHIYPALTLAKKLLAEGFRVYFVGNKRNLEYKIALENGLNFLDVNVSSMPRKISLGFIFWGFQTFFASLVALFYVLKYRPNASFATGGYVCAPTLIASKILKIPYMTHDSDTYPGIVSRVFSKYAKCATIAFPEAKKYLKCKDILLAGNPIRDNFALANRDEALLALGLENKKTIYITGGSQGAKTLNDGAIALIQELKENQEIQLILQTGIKNYDEVTAKLGELPKNILVKPYFQDTSLPLACADLVVSRGGSLSISEILASGTPSIIVPYPHAAKNHQELNARSVENIGCAVVLADSECVQNLPKIALEFACDNEKLSQMKLNISQNAKPNGTQEIFEKLVEIAGGR